MTKEHFVNTGSLIWGATAYAVRRNHDRGHDYVSGRVIVLEPDGHMTMRTRNGFTVSFWPDGTEERRPGLSIGPFRLCTEQHYSNGTA